MSNVYNGLATLGRVRAMVGLVLAVSIASSLSTSGAFMIRSAMSDKHTAKTTGTLSANCVSNVCTGTVTYTGGTLSWMGNAPAPKTVDVWYDPKNPKDAELGHDSTTGGIACIVCGLCVLIIGYLIYWVTQQSKVAAGLYGVDTVAEGVRNIV